MRRPKNPRTAPIGWLWLYDLADQVNVTGDALAKRARRDQPSKPEAFRRFGDGARSPWLVSEAEAQRLRQVYS